MNKLINIIIFLLVAYSISSMSQSVNETINLRQRIEKLEFRANKIESGLDTIVEFLKLLENKLTVFDKEVIKISATIKDLRNNVERNKTVVSWNKPLFLKFKGTYLIQMWWHQRCSNGITDCVCNYNLKFDNQLTDAKRHFIGKPLNHLHHAFQVQYITTNNNNVRVVFEHDASSVNCAGYFWYALTGISSFMNQTNNN